MDKLLDRFLEDWANGIGSANRKPPEGSTWLPAQLHHLGSDGRHPVSQVAKIAGTSVTQIEATYDRWIPSENEYAAILDNLKAVAR